MILRNLSKRNLKYLRIVILVAFCAGYVGYRFWLAARIGEAKELRTLYRYADGGDLNSVRGLAVNNSSEATALLEKLAQNQNAIPYSRLEAIAVLGKRRRLNSEALAPVLWIGQPFEVRHAVVGVFKQRGCDDSCTPAALYSLHEMWAGQLTGDERWSAQHPEFAATQVPLAAQNRRETENDFIALLNLNPCASRKTLKAEYVRDPEFVSNLEAKLGSC